MHHHHHHQKKEVVEEIIITQPQQQQTGFVQQQQQQFVQPQQFFTPQVQVSVQPTVVFETQKHGKQHQDTISFNDEIMLSGFQGPHRIAQVRVWFDQKFVLGIQLFYEILNNGQIIEGGKHYKHHHGTNVLEEIITINKGDHIVEVFGRSGDIIDYLGFRTQSGQTFAFGGPGGNQWDFKAPFGSHICGIIGGYAKELHHIELLVKPFQNQQQQQQQVIINQFGQMNINTQPIVVQTQYTCGKQRQDSTIIFNDQQLLVGSQGHKICAIAIFTDGFCVVGIETNYYIYSTGQIIQGTKHLGLKYHQQCVGQALQLEQDEFIVEFFGRAGDMVDALGVKTSKGRTLGPIGGTGGNFFEIRALQNEHFNGIHGAFGSHLHYFELHHGLIPSLQNIIMPQKNYGSQQGGFTQQQVQQVNQSMGYGQQIQYPVVQPSTTVLVIETLQKTYPNHPYFVKVLQPGVHISQLMGGVNPDSVFHDDYHDVVCKTGIYPQIHKIHLWHTQNNVLGFQVVYRNMNGQYTGGKHVGSQLHKEQHIESTLTLDNNEYITSVHGRAGAIVDHLTIRTSKGQEISVGGQGGEHHKNLIPEDGNLHQVVGFGCATNGHLHNIYLYYLG